MAKIQSHLYSEFFTTDSIKRKKELRNIIEDAIDDAMKNRMGETLQYWYFDGAEEGEVGNFEDCIFGNNLEIIYDNGGSCRSEEKTIQIPLSDIIEEIES